MKLPFIGAEIITPLVTNGSGVGGPHLVRISGEFFGTPNGVGCFDALGIQSYSHPSVAEKSGEAMTLKHVFG